MVPILLREVATQSTSTSTIRRIGYPVFCLLLILLFIKPLMALFHLSMSNDHYSHVLLIPAISLFFLFQNRMSLGISAGIRPFPGVVIAAAGLALLPGIFFVDLPLNSIVRLDLFVLTFLLVFTGGTLVVFGASLFTSNRFSWLILLLMLPLPNRCVDLIIAFFQYGSAEVVNVLFNLIGMTYIRGDQLTFTMPNIAIYIAKECSGIRSSTALVITGLLAGQLFLKTFPGKTVLVLFVIPLTLLKNGIRITTLSFLSDKYDPMWIIDSKLHHSGGIVFFGIILVLLFGILFAIGKIETAFLRKKPPAIPPAPDTADSGAVTK